MYETPEGREFTRNPSFLKMGRAKVGNFFFFAVVVEK